MICLFTGHDWQHIPLGKEIRESEWLISQEWICNRCGKIKQLMVEVGNGEILAFRQVKSREVWRK